MSTEDPFRGVELLDFMWNEDSTTSNITDAAAAAAADTDKPPLFDVEMFGPPELNTSYMLYPNNITRPPTWEIVIKVRRSVVFLRQHESLLAQSILPVMMLLKLLHEWFQQCCAKRVLFWSRPCLSVSCVQCESKNSPSPLTKWC